jgi:hypothetical protein
MTSEWLSRIEGRFWPEGFKRDIWMITDAARDPRIFPMLQELHLEYYCLYAGSLPPVLAAAAPYLVQLDYGYQETRQFLQHAWGNSWGVFLKCGAHANALRRHLRGLLVVLGPEGNRLVFRYYDPRVLRVYLPTCTTDELAAFFGPIERFWMEDEEPGIVLEQSFHETELIDRRFALEPSEPHFSGFA